MGRHMFAKAALIEAPRLRQATAGKPAEIQCGRARPTAENDYAPIRAFLASAPSDLRAVLSIYYETCLQGGCVDRSRALMPGLNESRADRDAWRGGDGPHSDARRSRSRG